MDITIMSVTGKGGPRGEGGFPVPADYVSPYGDHCQPAGAEDYFQMPPKRERTEAQIEARRRRRRRARERKRPVPYQFRPDPHGSNANTLSQWEELDLESNEDTSEGVDPPPLMSVKIDPSVITCKVPCLVSGGIPERGYEVGEFPGVPPHRSVSEAWPESYPQVTTPSTAPTASTAPTPSTATAPTPSAAPVPFTTPVPSTAPNPAVTPMVFEFHVSRPCPVCPRLTFFASETSLVSHWLTRHTPGVQLMGCAYCEFKVPMDKAQPALRRHYKTTHVKESKSRLGSVESVFNEAAPLPAGGWVLEPLLQAQLEVRRGLCGYIVPYSPLGDRAIRQNPTVGVGVPVCPEWEWRRLWAGHPAPTE
jgi:hypothetical protein